MATEQAGAVTRAAQSDDELAFLEALRDRLSRTIDDPELLPKDLSPLTRRLAEVHELIKAERVRLADETKRAEALDDEDDSFDPATL